MKLYIAEKPSLARAIVDALPTPHKKQQGYYQCGNDNLVTWCVGHILEQAEPETYDESFKKWRLAHLPIIPEQWQLKPKFKTKSQLAVIRKLVKQSKTIVHAGDPDREGQLLVDEVLDYLKLTKSKREQVQRLLISDLNTKAVKQALNNVKSNQNFIPLSVSALARSRADWLYGINLTRAYTIQGGKVGYQGVLSVGRVQTPVLGLIVNRDHEIAHFQPKPYYQVDAELVTDTKATFKARWQPSEACQPYMDEDGRIVVRKLAENVVNRISDKPAVVSNVKVTPKQEAPPLLYNLSSLQIDAAKQFSMNAKLVLDICQSLYEKHKLITYPRSDCRYLPNAHWRQAPHILKHISHTDLAVAQGAKCADSKLKSAAWNDKKVGAHHAIIPTEKKLGRIQLNDFEKNIYQLICRQYVAQFHPHHQYATQKVTVEIEGGIFTASEKTVSVEGWKTLFKRNGKEQTQSLPKLNKGDALHCLTGHLLAKMTEPPKAFTDASLLAAMTGIARFVKDKTLKSILKETDGLGTEATRASIIELLFKRGFLHRIGKTIVATDAGKGLINALPTMCSQPDMTAKWEAELNKIADKQSSYAHFMQPLYQILHQLIEQATEHLPESLRGVKVSVKPAFKKRRRKQKAA